ITSQHIVNRNKFESSIDEIFVSQKHEPLDEKLQDFEKKQQLIITMLQSIKESSSEHHAVAATKEHVTTEGILARQHAEKQVEKMQKTIEQLSEYFDFYSSRKQLMIYSLLMLFVSCVFLLAVIIRGSLIISSPIPELAVIISIGFLLMAHFAPQYKRKKKI
ncbi:MAG: hypothetical protein Q7K21_06425, partial [Elusimicrobiota bacterium]|nr:hypothetical protein [Elusimicrobiota bacterium]